MLLASNIGLENLKGSIMRNWIPMTDDDWDWVNGNKKPEPVKS